MDILGLTNKVTKEGTSIVVVVTISNAEFTEMQGYYYWCSSHKFYQRTQCTQAITGASQVLVLFI